MLEEKIIKIFKDNIEEDVELDFKKPLKDMSFIDSLAILNILVALEKEFEVSFDLEDLDDVFIDMQSIKEYIVANQK